MTTLSRCLMFPLALLLIVSVDGCQKERQTPAEKARQRAQDRIRKLKGGKADTIKIVDTIEIEKPCDTMKIFVPLPCDTVPPVDIRIKSQPKVTKKVVKKEKKRKVERKVEKKQATYKVKKGDTIYSIAKQFGVAQDKVIATKPLKVGDEVKINLD